MPALPVTVTALPVSPCSVVIGGPRGNIAGAAIADTGYVFVCPLFSNMPCARGSDYEQLLYDTTGEFGYLRLCSFFMMFVLMFVFVFVFVFVLLLRC